MHHASNVLPFLPQTSFFALKVDSARRRPMQCATLSESFIGHLDSPLQAIIIIKLLINFPIEFFIGGNIFFR